ncbi:MULTISPECIES: XdhC family protein [Salinibaculum]|uniref:XdhC family protein n=1 Tax=Salinibaculum TaxID=2732368 RepID=UPI0030CEA700
MTRDAGEPWAVTAKDRRALARSLRSRDASAAVVTVAAVEGSAYRRPGAKMVVPAGGEPVGAVTAGCLEGPAVDVATTVIESGRPRTEVFDMTADDSGEWGLGLGCNGVIDLFVEPLDASLDPVLDVLADGEPVTVVTVVEAGEDELVGSRVLVTRDGTVRDVPARRRVPDGLLDDAADTIEQVRGTAATQTAEVGSGATLLVDGLQPVPTVLAVGSQPDVEPVTRFADDVGFRVVVYSPRGATDESTFPRADIVRTGNPSDVADVVETPEHTYAVVMSHNLVDDRLAVEALLDRAALPYVGLMGPRKRFDSLRDLLADDGVALPAEALERISTPVGLDLGGGTPAEIALSVVGEVVAVSNGRAGGRLSDRAGPIHPRTAVDGGD